MKFEILFIAVGFSQRSWNGNENICFIHCCSSLSINGTAMKFEILFVALGFSQRG